MANADLLVTGARIHTLDPARPTAGALAVTGGVITAVGEPAELTALRGPGTTVLDLAGATVTPGLTDGHTHPLMGLDVATGLDLSGCRDLAALRTALAEAARATPRGGWVTGWNLDHNTFRDHPIDRTAIDDVLGAVPAFLRLYDAHSALVSGRALEIAGITGPRPFAQRAEVVCDAGGRPTGHLVEHAAIDLVTPFVPAPAAAERRARLLDLLRGMAATGLTTGHVMDLQSPGALELLAAAEDGDALPVRLLIHPWCMPGDGDEGVDRLIALQRQAGRDWRVAGVKFFIDGTVEGGTAWLEHPDCHGQGTDAFWPDAAEYTRALHRLDAAGVATATHAIGDAGVRHVLDGVEALGTPGHGTGSSTSRPCPTPSCRASPPSAWPPPCSRATARTPAPTARTPGPGGWAASVPNAPGGAATSARPAPPWCSARTGRSPATTRAGCSPRRGCGARRARRTPRQSGRSRRSPR
ncbi:hypothetical protein GCM10025734_63390 [Kitasatospora paranensis]